MSQCCITTFQNSFQTAPSICSPDFGPVMASIYLLWKKSWPASFYTTIIDFSPIIKQLAMMSSCLRLVRPAPARSLLRVRSFSSTSHLHLKLAYDLYEPPIEKSKSAIGNPIVFVHGLFGSKKNNRSMSKYAADIISQCYTLPDTLF